MIEIKIIIDEIDYNSLAKLAATMFKKKEDKSLLGKYMPDSAINIVANGVANLFSSEQKDEAVVNLLAKHEDKAVNILQKMVTNKGVKLKVKGMSAKRVKKEESKFGH